MPLCHFSFFFFFFNDTATTEIYTLSLHDALPIYHFAEFDRGEAGAAGGTQHGERSEEHTSELQSLQYLVCRLLLEKKKIELAEHRLLLATEYILGTSLPILLGHRLLRHQIVFVHILPYVSVIPFFFNDTATTEIYTLSLHDALPI